MNIDKLRVPKGQDKRVKITELDKLEIKALNKKGVPIREIARQFQSVCCRRSIQFIIYPERLDKVKELHRVRRKDGRYYNKEKHKMYMRKHRQHKKELLNNGFIHS